MNDYDLEALAIVETRVKQTRNEVLAGIKTIFAPTSIIITSETRKTLASVDLAINRLRPADRKFTLGQIIAMRKIFDEIRRRMEAVVEKAEADLARAQNDIEVYVAQGVHPHELDINVKSLYQELAPLQGLFEEMTSRMSRIHPLAYGVFADAGYDPERNKKRFDEIVDNGVKSINGRLRDFRHFIESQETVLMSSDGLDKRQELIFDLQNFVSYINRFLRSQH